MTRITNADHVLALLRAQLERAAKAAKRSATPSSPQSASASATTRVRQMASEEPPLSESELERALVAALLTDEFGPSVAHDPNHQRVIDEVMTIINRDSACKALLKRAASQFTGL